MSPFMGALIGQRCQASLLRRRFHFSFFVILKSVRFSDIQCMQMRSCDVVWYCVKDAMSRTQNEHRRLSAYFASHWFGKGAALANFAADGAAGVWLSHNMLPTTRFHNAWTGYYFELVLLMDATSRYGSAHTRPAIPAIHANCSGCLDSLL